MVVRYSKRSLSTSQLSVMLARCAGLSLRRMGTVRAPAMRLGLSNNRSMAMGPASGGSVSDEMLEKLAGLSTQSLIDGLWVMGWPDATIEGARGLAKGMKCAGALAAPPDARVRHRGA